MIIYLILITSSHDNVWISLGENCCWSLLGHKGLSQVSVLKARQCNGNQFPYSYFVLMVQLATQPGRLNTGQNLSKVVCRFWQVFTCKIFSPDKLKLSILCRFPFKSVSIERVLLYYYMYLRLPLIGKSVLINTLLPLAY